MSLSPNLPTSRSTSTLSPDPPGQAGSRSRDGRTPPPPAPSAAYARRAREIIEDETGSSPYNTLVKDEDEIVEGGGSVASGYRRARAGTMPSKLQDASESYPLPPEPSPPVPITSASVTPMRTSALSPAYPTTPSTRPTLRHTTSSAANLETPTSANRNRSGSLTLPKNHLGNAFGSSPFSNVWLANPSQARSPLGNHQSEDLTAYTSTEISSSSMVGDELNFSTLDYLGLADGGDLPPASISGLKEQAQRAIANSGPVSRLRANTVSNFARPLRQSVTAINDPLYDQTEEAAALSRAIGDLQMYDTSDHYEIDDASGQYNRDIHRPRATTIGAFDHPHRRHPNVPPGYLSSIPQSPVHGNMVASMSLGSFGYPPRSRSDRDLTHSRDSSRGPRLSGSSHASRSGTPDVGGTSTPQMPTRSLWIGNLDVNATSDALLHVFAPYGAIESVRMLPEKTCAFVNFMEKPDAMRARDDVLNRMGGHVTALSETAPVRIGFGKIDSAPSGPPASAIAAAPSGLVFTGGQPVAISAVGVTTPGSMTIPPQGGAENDSLDQPSDLSSLPTRALWIGSIPGTTSSSTLLQIFSPFGPVESARVLMHKACGFVNYERLDSAIAARNALNGRDILGSDIGAIRIGFARVPTKSPTIGGTEEENSISDAHLTEKLSNVNGAAAVSNEQQLSAEGGGVENYRSQLVIDLVKAGVHEQVMEKGLAAAGGAVTDQQMIMQVLSQDREEDGDIKAAAEPRPPATYYTAIPMISDRNRRFDSARLKELRKKLDSGTTTEEIDLITTDLLEDCAELASDYIGNTIIQKLYERCSSALRYAMLERIAPHLAMIGVHKNGTWAAQKIIECSLTGEERALITNNLRPFAPPLMCDSLGNYVCAGTLRFGAPWSDYVFDAMMDRMWDIAQNRFGARCMRTCLESPHTSLYQRKRIATGVILNSIPLATNPNGALLLTWLVDQSNLPGRYGLLANRFVPHIAHLCTHKLASLTVLRIITQTADPTAATTLVNGIFSSNSDATLTEILSDANNGAQVIGKIIAISTLPTEEKNTMVEAVRRVLPTIKASSTPPYRQLLEAVGLPAPAGHLGSSPFGTNRWTPQSRPGSGAAFSYGYPYQGNGSPTGHVPTPTSMGYSSMGQNLSPLLIPQNMPLGQSMRTGSPNLNGSPRTPQARHRGRLSPGSQMMSPGSDPFNPFASPSIDMPYMQSQGGVRLGSSLAQPPVTFEQQPNLGGLGIMGQNNGQGQMYYGGNMMRPGMYAGFQA